MTPTGLAVIALGALTGGGVLLLVVALRGTPPRPTRPAAGLSAGLERLGRLGVAALLAGLVVLVLTRWVVVALAAAALVLAWPALFGGGRAEREATQRVEGLAAWIESLRDTIAGAVGLEQAIPATLYASAPSIRPQLRLLVDRLRVRVPLHVALQRFADDLDDPSADLVVAALVLNSKMRGPGLRQVLGSLADAARAELDMRQRVAAGRSGTRKSAQIVMGFSVLVILLLAVFNREYVAPYSTPTGQLVLLVVVACFAGGFLWMKRLSGVDLPERFLVQPADPATVAAATRQETS
ncbi:type II secretion system F family protein [Sanguibacter suaedae]|uniref:Type II secretion system F family protein n=1 Tax=Sanguibacter suaedae TaxID=2795737 RepID=A0A934ICB1_9MICO|nr:type II secretion system F family protein [Sanguibacter suaedae]MBI9115328.1 type II secretion system F family protein [Sanguibacter suaedae]